MQEVIAGLTTPRVSQLSMPEFEAYERQGLSTGYRRQSSAAVSRQQVDRRVARRSATEKRVAAMLAGTSRKPDEIVGHMQPTEFRVRLRIYG